MTEKEAIERLHFLSVCGFSGFTTDEPLRMAIQALKKRVPMKPVLKNAEGVMCVDYADGLSDRDTTDSRKDRTISGKVTFAMSADRELIGVK